MSLIHAWAAPGPKQALVPFDFDPGPLAPDQVEIAVEYCGICHSDLSMWADDWDQSEYPLVPGHEAVGRIAAVGVAVSWLQIGQRVGIGWTAASCMHCPACLSGDQHLCADAVATIVSHHGGFADRLRAQAVWAIPIPEALDAASAGPLLCGGITVFAPFLTYGVKPTDRVGIIGIGGLGHMALKFAAAWGCEVTAFTSSESKSAEARGFGAHHVVSIRDKDAIRARRQSFDFLMVTPNVPLDWRALLSTVAPKGRLHFVGAVLEPIAFKAFDLIGHQRAISGSPTGAPAAIATMLDFAARHRILPQVEHFPMSRVNDALAHLESGQARYRIVLGPAGNLVAGESRDPQ
jgi:alcohol/geraniol dehydrogenase (NADP+)